MFCVTKKNYVKVLCYKKNKVFFLFFFYLIWKIYVILNFGIKNFWRKNFGEKKLVSRVE